MRTTAIAITGFMAGMILTAGPARAELTAPPALSHSYPLRPPPALQGDPRSEVDELLRQITELDDSWDTLTPQQQQERFKELQQFLPTVEKDVKNLPPGQQLEVEGKLGSAIMRLLDIERKIQGSN